MGQTARFERYQEDLAYLHHVGFGDLARQAAPWVLAALRAAGIHEGTVVDLGCGSGLLLSALLDAGYQAVGVDASAAMLDIASSTAPGARLIQTSLYDLPIPPCHAIVAIGEPLNYASGPESEPPIVELLSRAAAALPSGGLLLFDAMIRPRSGVNAYRTWAAGDDWACLAEVVPQPTGRALRRAITTFRFVDGAYRRGAEDHWLHLFQATRLSQQLKHAGFSVRTASAYGKVRLLPGRRLFHCMKARA